MKTAWTKGLTPERKTIVTSDYTSSVGARMRLTELLNEKIETARRGRVAANNYDSPSWAYQQADSIGYERAINEIISLIS